MSINKMDNYPIFDSPTSVYKLNGFSLQELLSQFWKHINEVIEGTNATKQDVEEFKIKVDGKLIEQDTKLEERLTSQDVKIDGFMQWVKEEGLPVEVVKEIELMYEDGRLADIINNTIFEDLNTKIDDNKNKTIDYLSNRIELGYTISKFKGSAVAIPELTSYEMTNKEFIDKMKETNCNIVTLQPSFWLVNETSLITGYKGGINEQDILELCQYAKNKGLKVFLKPHVTGNNFTSYASINPANLTIFMESYSLHLSNLFTVCKDYIDIFSVTNEMDNQTKLNALLWESIIMNLRNINPSVLITNSSRVADLKTNVFLDKLDFLGVNIYAPIVGDLETPLNEQKKSVFKRTDLLNNVIDKSNEISKSVMITEVGILPSVKNFSNPETWVQNGPIDFNACIRYYSATVSEYLNSSFIGVIINSNEYLTNKSASDFVSEMFKEVV